MRLTFIEWRSTLKKEGKKTESKCHDVNVKSLKQQSTLVCIFSYVKEENI